MTPQQAISLLDQMAALAETTRTNHQQAVIAVQVLTDFTKPKPEEPEANTKK